MTTNAASPKEEDELRAALARLDDELDRLRAQLARQQGELSVARARYRAMCAEGADISLPRRLARTSRLASSSGGSREVAQRARAALDILAQARRAVAETSSVVASAEVTEPRDDGAPEAS